MSHCNYKTGRNVLFFINYQPSSPSGLNSRIRDVCSPKPYNRKSFSQTQTDRRRRKLYRRRRSNSSLDFLDSTTFRGSGFFGSNHGLRTPNEGINQRNLKFGPMWQTKYALAIPMNLGLEFYFRPCREGDFLTGRPQSVVQTKSLEFAFEIYSPLVQLLQSPEYVSNRRSFGLSEL